MVCIQCESKTTVFNSRSQHRTNQVWRRRQCLGCGYQFTTHEALDFSAVWSVKSNTSGIEAFNRDRLMVSVLECLRHRKRPLDDAAAITETVTSKLATKATNGLIDSGQIVSQVQVALNRFDKTASIYYAALRNRA